jgi:hypothetical protein
LASDTVANLFVIENTIDETLTMLWQDLHDGFGRSGQLRQDITQDTLCPSIVQMRV